MIDQLAFDADDTLWHNERLYRSTELMLAKILEGFAGEEEIISQVLQTESANIGLFGYGIKSFTLSMIETAVELSEGEVTAGQIQEIIELGRSMLTAEVELLEGVQPTLQSLAQHHQLMLITKGDSRDQGSKLQRSGLRGFFTHVEIVADKNRPTYEMIFTKYQIQPERFLMVGNSLKSDILPVIACGGSAVHIPYEIIWEHEAVPDPPKDLQGFYQLERIEQLPDLLDHLFR